MLCKTVAYVWTRLTLINYQQWCGQRYRQPGLPRRNLISATPWKCFMKLVTFKSLTSLKYVGWGEEPTRCHGGYLSDCFVALQPFSWFEIWEQLKKKEKKKRKLIRSVSEETSAKIFVFETDRLILLNCNQTRSELCKRAAMTTADYRNHSVSEQSNNCQVAAWENAGPRRPTDKPAGPGWLLSLEVEPSSLLRLPLMALARKGVRVPHCANEAFRNAKNPDAPVRTHTWPDCSPTCSWGLFDNTPVTFHLSGLKPNYLTITLYKWFSPPQWHQWIMFVCQSGTGQKQDSFRKHVSFIHLGFSPSFNWIRPAPQLLLPLFVQVYQKNQFTSNTFRLPRKGKLPNWKSNTGFVMSERALVWELDRASLWLVKTSPA